MSESKVTQEPADHSVTEQMTFPNLNILSMYTEGGGKASVLEWEGAYVQQGGRVGVEERGEGEDKRMGAVKSVNRGALLPSSDVLAACPTRLAVIEA